MTKMEKALIERWKEDASWKSRWTRIVLWIFISADEKINVLEDMDYTSEGYLDLRGFQFNWDVNYKEYMDDELLKLIQNSRNLIANKRFEKVDFSYANFAGRYMAQCEFEQCIFHSTTMRGITDSECQFVDCVFRKGVYGGSLGLGESCYKNVQFLNVKMHSTQMYWPNYENCIFSNCNLRRTDFGGSHFKNVKFVGQVNQAWFRGKMECSEGDRYWESKYERWNQVLPMDVDFSEATLSHLTITDFCDLSAVILPKDASCYLIPNLVVMGDDIMKRLEKRKNRVLEILLKHLEYYLQKREDKTMGILCLNDIYEDIQKKIVPEEQQESYKLLKEICDELLDQGILTLGKLA